MKRSSRPPVLEPRPSPRRRALSEEERELWDLVAKHVKPLRKHRAPKPPAGQRAESSPAAPAMRPASSPRPVAAAPAPRVAKPAMPPLAPLGKRERTKLSRGRSEIEARLDLHGMARATVFNLNPAAQAQSFAEQGFEYLHVVDLDGAFAGKPVNAEAVEAMLKTIKIPVQLGGGIRDLKTVEAWLDKGITRVIIGTAAVRDPELVKSAAKKFPSRVAVGLDARDGKVAVEGWAETSQVTVLEIAKRFEDAGVAAIIFTDIARDGLLKGLNLDATIALADAISIPVIASGGLASIEDVKAM